MDNFWKWLKRANARAVFFCLLVALVGVLAWWAWKLYSPVRVPVSVAGVSQEQSSPPIGLLDFMDSQKSTPTNRTANLFVPPESSAPSPPPPKPIDPTEPPKAQVKPDTEKRPPKPPPPSPFKEVVQLTYRGMMVRGDGTSAALIWDSKTKRAAFYPAGTNVFGLKLKTIAPETLNVDQADGSEAILQRGTPSNFTMEESP